MSDDLISLEELSAVRQLGYNGDRTYYKVFKWFRKRWGYVSWIEQIENKFIYKIYARGAYHRPMHITTKYPHCKNYEEAQIKLLKELVIIVKEIE